MCRIGDVFVVKPPLEHRDRKHCVYVSVSKKYLLYINEFERPALYDGLEIKKTQKKPWLDADRYIGCRNFVDFEKLTVLKKAGRVEFSDIKNIRDRMQKYSDEAHRHVLRELDDFIAAEDY